MKYFANFEANHSSFFEKAVEFSNKREAVKYIREVAEGERYENSPCEWVVYDEAKNVVASGGMDMFGRRYRVIK